MAVDDEQNDFWPKGPLYDWLRILQGGRVLAGGLATIIGLWCFVLIVPPLFMGLEKSGSLGDTFGIMNGFIGGLTLLGAGYAVFSQNEQLKIARKQIEDADHERAETFRLLHEQSKSLLDAAKLQAINAIGQMDTASFQYRSLPEHERVWLYDDLIRVNRSRQYAEILLTDMESPLFDWMDVPVANRTAIRKFYIVMARRAHKSVIDASSRAGASAISGFITEIDKMSIELDLLVTQPNGDSLGVLIWSAERSLEYAKADLLKAIEERDSSLVPSQRAASCFFGLEQMARTH
jgi:hypothetical protein